MNGYYAGDGDSSYNPRDTIISNMEGNGAGMLYTGDDEEDMDDEETEMRDRREGKRRRSTERY